MVVDLALGLEVSKLKEEIGLRDAKNGYAQSMLDTRSPL